MWEEIYERRASKGDKIKGLLARNSTPIPCVLFHTGLIFIICNYAWKQRLIFNGLKREILVSKI